jgi:hypothetical protein
MSMYTLNGYYGGKYILIYNRLFDNYLPHSYNFTDNINLTLNEGLYS